MGSTWHTEDEMVFSLNNVTLYSSKGKGPESTESTDTNINYRHRIKKLSLEHSVIQWGKSIWPVVGFSLELDRYFINHIMSYYIPSMLFVIVSWISFVIPPEVIPGRMALLITILLVLVNLFGTIISTQPPSHGPTYLAIWTFSCIMFVTAALFAYAVLLLIQRQQTWSNGKKKFVLVDKLVTKRRIIPEGMINSKERDDTQNKWDKHCLVLFPLTFLIFNFIYWPIVVANHLAKKNSF